ncbi:MAG: DmsE family decaheme c-type cytochrome [Gemmatimonadetes bacterium]|nr:DmsE family decaheme c-type cytochrome [Gemmatimonadota bacterium]
MFAPPQMPRATAVLGMLWLCWMPREMQAQKKQVDWAALNPAFQGAAFVNDAQVCQACHQDPMRGFGETPHARVFRAGRAPAQGECESCHGPRSKHIENPGREFAWANLSADQESTICLQCHEGGARMGWKAGAHPSADVACTSCHDVMAARSEQAMLARSQVPETCYTCHGEIRAQMSKSSHHPVREGRMDCAGCHNVHGSAPGLLRTATLNETCLSCHSEKRGPFVWEHAPVRESCATCHEAHGSSNRSLLARKDAFLCLQCHSYGGHINLPRYNRVSNPYGSGCVNCHVSVHGSNHPSGAKLTR